MGSTPFLLRAFNSILGREQNIRSSHNALKIITTEHERTHAGMAWSHQHAIGPIAAGSSYSHLIIPNSGTGVDLHLRNAKFSVTAGPGEVELFESPFTDANSLGTEVTSDYINRKRTSTNGRGFTAYDQPFTDANSLGRQLDTTLIQALLAYGSAEPIGLYEEAILDDTKQYLVRYTNRGVNVSSFTSSKFFMYSAGD